MRRNGNITFGVYVALVAGCIVGEMDYFGDSPWWLRLLVALFALGLYFYANDLVDRGVKDELEKARKNEMLRKAGLK